jgi:tetratricopeptide (TPR) repeat protein
MTFDSTVAATLIDTEPATMRIHRRPPLRRRNIAYAAVAAALAITGVAVAVLVGVAADGHPEGAATQRSSVASTTTRITTTPTQDGAALNGAGFARMQAGDYAGALPLLERAVRSLSGSGSLAEAYAGYNLAYTRFALGRCDGVLMLLDRSERIQGERGAIDALRSRAEATCNAVKSESGHGKGHGKKDGND